MRFQFNPPWVQRFPALFRWSDRAVQPGMAEPPTPVPATAEWDEAFTRIESYLRAHRLESRVLLNQLTTEIIQVARPLAAQHPELSPVTVAMKVAHARIGEWLQRNIGEGDWTDERFRARGRLALLLARVGEEHPQHFLGGEPLETAVVAQLRFAQLQPGPEVRLSSMPAAPLDFPLAEAAEEKWTTFSRSVFFRSAASWILLAGFVGVAWLAFH
jgi:hypothetical protein